MAKTKGSDNGKSSPAETSINSPKWSIRRRTIQLRTASARKPSKKLQEMSTSDIEPRLTKDLRKTERTTAILEGIKKMKKVKDVKTPERQHTKDKLTAPTRFSPRKPKTTQGDKPNTHQEKLKTVQEKPKTTQEKLKTVQENPKTTQGKLKTVQEKPKTTQENLNTTQEKQPNPLQPPQDKTNPETALPTNKTNTQKKLPYQTKKRRTNLETVRDEALITDLTVPEAVVQPPVVVPLRTSPRSLAKLPAMRRQQPTPAEVQQATEVSDEHPIPDENNTQPPAPAIDQFVTTQHSSDIDEEDEGPDLSSYPSIRCRSAGFIEAGHIVPCFNLIVLHAKSL